MVPPRSNYTHGIECRLLVTLNLASRAQCLPTRRKSIRYIEQANQLPEIKQARPEFNDIHSQVLQDVLRRLDKALQNFFRRVKERNNKAGFPRFRSRKRYDSLTYAQSGFSINGDKLRLSKIGDVRINCTAPLGKLRR